MKSEEVKGLKRYLVRYNVVGYGDQEFELIGPEFVLETLLKNHSLSVDDEIYEVIYVGKVKVEKTLKIES